MTVMTAATQRSHSLPSFLLLVCLPLLLLDLPRLVHASADDALLYDPITVAFFSSGVGVDGTDFAGKTPDDLRAEFRAGIVDFLTDSLGGDGVDAEGNVPLSDVSFLTQGTDGFNGTLWQFSLHYTNLRPDVKTFATFQRFATYCLPDSEGNCASSASYHVADSPVARRWLSVPTKVALVCCDGQWRQLLQDCRDCRGRNFLPLILGLIGGFLGLVVLCVCTAMYCKRRKEARRLARQSGGGPASVADWHGRSVVPQFQSSAPSAVVVQVKARDTDRGAAKKGKK